MRHVNMRNTRRYGQAARRSTALVRVRGETLIKGFAIGVWLLGCAATAWLGTQLFPGAQPGKVALGAVIAQLLLTFGQLRVVRLYFGGLPTFFFAVDTLTNFLALVGVVFGINFSSGAAFVQSALTAATSGEWYLNLALAAVLLFVGYKVAVTPERVIDTGEAE